MHATQSSQPGNDHADYATAYESAALIDRSRHGRLRVEGRDRVDLLQRLSTNDLQGLGPGQGAPGLFLTSKGRMMELFDALVIEDHLLLALSSAEPARTREWIERFTFVEDVTCLDVSKRTVELLVVGPRAASILEGLGIEEPSALTGRDHRAARIEGVEIRVGAAQPVAGGAFRLITPSASGASLLEVLGERGLLPVDAATAETLRIEAGLPAAGSELDERFNPLEAGLKEAISFTKGCYTGQEVIARLTTYDKVQRRLCGLRIDADRPAAAGTPVVAGGSEIGTVTSSVFSPGLSCVIALAYINRRHATPGGKVEVSGQDAVVSDLPFRFPTG